MSWGHLILNAQLKTKFGRKNLSVSHRGLFGLHKEALISYSEKTDMGLDSYKSSEDT